MMEWDSDPPPSLGAMFEQAPLQAYRSNPQRFRLPWEPIYDRKRLHDPARVLILGQDPAAVENVARRILVGDAGQRVRGTEHAMPATRPKPG
jgi:uracil-DNA glycosylase